MPLVAALCATALAACGGDDSSSSDSSGSAGTSAATTSAGAAPTPAAVLVCLKSAGLDAEDQSSNTSGETIGIDYPGGRTVISFEASEADAETSEIAAKGAGGDVLRVGTVVVSFAEDTEATYGRPAIESCITG